MANIISSTHCILLGTYSTRARKTTRFKLTIVMDLNQTNERIEIIPDDVQTFVPRKNLSHCNRKKPIFAFGTREQGQSSALSSPHDRIIKHPIETLLSVENNPIRLNRYRSLLQIPVNPTNVVLETTTLSASYPSLETCTAVRAMPRNGVLGGCVANVVFTSWRSYG